MSDTVQEREDQMGDDSAEQWCDDCRGYIHAPWCPSYPVKVIECDDHPWKDCPKCGIGICGEHMTAFLNHRPHEHQPAARSGGEGELSVRDFDYHQYGDVTLNVTNNGVTVAIAYMQGRGREAKEWAEKIAAAYNQHQSLVAERERLLKTLPRQATCGR